MDQTQMWALNIGLLIGILMGLAILLILGFVGWTGIRVWLFARQQKKVNGGRPSAPQGSSDELLFRERGMCAACGRMMERTMESARGVRICTGCYAKAAKRRTASAPPGNKPSVP